MKEEREHHVRAARPRDGLSAEVVVRHPAFWRRVATGGTLGSAESYAAGEWDTPDLTSVVRLVARNVATMDGLEGGLAALRRPVDAVLARAPAQHADRQPPQHRRALRPGRRLLRSSCSTRP